MARPLVSIVMPTFNRAAFLPATVESVFEQTLRDWELIVADDGSDEPVLDYLLGLEYDARVRVLKLPHSGKPSVARNAGIAAARAPLVAFLDSDDLWAPTKLERQLAQLRAEPECRWCYSAFVIVDAEGMAHASERYRPWRPHRGRIFAETVRGTASISAPSLVVATTELLAEVGVFDDALDCSEDYDLWLRLALASPVCLVDEPLVRIRRYAGNFKRELSAPYRARDYSLLKLARGLGGAERRLVEEERGRNALALAAATYDDGGRWRSLAVVGKSLPLGWKHPCWWCGGARAFARSCLGLRRRRAAT